MTLIPGDGIGPEIATAVAAIFLEASGFRPGWDTVVAGESAIRETGSPLPESLIESIAQTRVALKGPLRTPVGSCCKSVNVELRQHFTLFAASYQLSAFGSNLKAVS
jgi:isocitrate dehydrogenase (NAD+)